MEHEKSTKAKKIRIVAIVGVILMFLASGLLWWINKPFANSITPAVGSEAIAAVTTAAPQPISATIMMTGNLQPLQVINVGCPFSGKVERLYFHYGDVVKAGQILVTMDASEMQVKYREAKAIYIKAAENLRQVETWAVSTDVARATRSLSKAKLSLENQKKSVNETERLFKKGIIPTNEYESAKQQYQAQQLDYQTAEEEVKAVTEKGNKTNVQIAKFEMQNALARMKLLETELSGATIVAPAGGIVMRPVANGSAKDAKSVEQGHSVQQGDVVLAIGDLSGFSVTSKVDEVDVTKVREGQVVRVTGDAFPGVLLDGTIRGISPQTEEGDARSAPSYGITVHIPTVTAEQRKKILVGMTANLEIMLMQNASAVMVPLSAVIIEGGAKYVLKKQANAASVKTPVDTGHTTIDSVEIKRGVAAGDVIETRRTPQAVTVDVVKK